MTVGLRSVEHVGDRTPNEDVIDETFTLLVTGNCDGSPTAS